MSVLIKGIEMPKDGCRGCLFVNRKWKGDVCPFLKREVTGNVERGGFQTDCPLIPVLPHGRLIDAEELRKQMYHEAFETDSDMQKWDSGCWIRYKMFENALESAPTIVDAEECE